MDLLEAAGTLSSVGWMLNMYGASPLAPALAARSRVCDNVEVRGPLPSQAVEAEITKADLLILPSRFDGWGAVVNEALAHGCRVLASDRVQASVLLGPENERGLYIQGGRCGQFE